MFNIYKEMSNTSKVLDICVTLKPITHSRKPVAFFDTPPNPLLIEGEFGRGFVDFNEMFNIYREMSNTSKVLDICV